MLAPSQLAMSLALFVGSAHCARVQFAQHRIAPWPAHRGQISALLQRGPRRCRRLGAAARGAPRSTGAYLRPGLVCLEPHWQPPEGAASRRRIRGVGAPAARYADRRCSIKRLWKRHLVKAGKCWACRGTLRVEPARPPGPPIAGELGRTSDGGKEASDSPGTARAPKGSRQARPRRNEIALGAPAGSGGRELPPLGRRSSTGERRETRAELRSLVVRHAYCLSDLVAQRPESLESLSSLLVGSDRRAALQVLPVTRPLSLRPGPRPARSALPPLHLPLPFLVLNPGWFSP